MTKRHYREMTVANIREPKDADFVQVLFLESARFYQISKNNDEAMRLLRDALAKRRLLKVGLASFESNVIEEIQQSD